MSSDIEKRIEAIEDRNRLVELDKAWEASLARKGIVAVLTYLVIGVYLLVISTPNPWVNAVVPTLGFMLSTLLLPFFKQMWLRNRKKD